MGSTNKLPAPTTSLLASPVPPFLTRFARLLSENAPAPSDPVGTVTVFRDVARSALQLRQRNVVLCTHHIYFIKLLNISIKLLAIPR